MADKTGILEGNYANGRQMITINNLADVKAKESRLKNVIKEWLQLVDK